MKFKKIMILTGSTVASMSVMLSMASITASADTTVDLSSGKYEVPILSVGSAAPLQPVKDAINTVFGDTAVLIVDESGNADIEFTNKHMVINLFGGSFDANVAWVEGATVISQKDEIYTNINGNLMDSSVHTTDNITVPDVFTVDCNLDESNSQDLTVGVDFMAVMMGKPIEEYSTTITPVLDMENAEKINEFGSAGTRLNAGKYTLPVSMKKATDISSSSMAAGCVKDAVLTVNDDGTADVTVNLQAASAFAFTLWASDWNIYQSYAASGDKSAANYTTDADGNVDSITFRLPDNSWDGVYVNMFIGGIMSTRQDAYFAMDFANAVPKGESVVKTYTGTGHVNQFGKYDVVVTVTVTDGIITSIDVKGENFGGAYAEFNKIKLQQAVDGLKDSCTGLSEDDAEGIYAVDAVSSATISSQAIRDAIMDALKLVIKDEIINVPAEKLSEGEYEVEIAFYSDVVEHSLVENETAKAKISVDADGNMTLSTNIINGTSKEPLYVLEFNGYYEDNNTSNALSKEGSQEKKEVSSYGDEFMDKGTEVITNVSFPLVGEYAKIYNTNFKLYVPAMNALNGELSGVVFENGKFDVDCYAKIYWDSIVKTSGGGYGSAGTVLEEGTYRVPISMMKSTDITQGSMAGGVIKDSFVTIDENGNTEISIDLQSLTVMDVTAWAKDWKIYRTQGVDGELINAVETKNEDGNVVNIKFNMPDNSWDGVYCNMNSGKVSDAYLAIDWSEAKPLSNTCDISAQEVTTDEKITYNVDIVNNSSDDKTGDVLCALYSDNKLVGIATNNSVELTAGKTVSLAYDFGLTEYDTVKVFIWDDTLSISPLFEGEVFSQGVIK